MKLDLFDIDEFVKVNNCPEVTNPVFWNFDGTPTADGLFSYDLFGISDEERKNTFGYINLKGNFLHPLIYLMFIKKTGSLGSVIRGEKYAVIVDKKIKIVDEDFKGADTGLEFIYDHFYEINWIDEIEESEMDSIDKKTRLKFLKSLKREEVFIRKWLVLPPFYRAESSTNRSMGDSINKLYKELISRVSGLSLGFSFELFGSETKLRIQNILKDIYLSTLAPISGKNLIFDKGSSEGTLAGSGKNSMVRKHLLGKNVDWGASSVITSPPNSDANKFKDKPVPYGYGAFPLATLLSLFQPFYVHECSDILEDALYGIEAEMGSSIKKLDVKQFNSARVEKLVKTYIKSINQRFDPIEFEFTDNEGKKQKAYIRLLQADSDNSDEIISRPMTITDLLFMVSESICRDKHVLVTRFPITNAQSIYPSKIKVLTTDKTKDLLIGLYEDEMIRYENYPIIPEDPKKAGIESSFYDVMLCGNAYLDALGGDYDRRHALHASTLHSRSKSGSREPCLG